MKRKIMKQLRNWKTQSQGSYALLIEGARRVGKSYIAEAFAREEYRSHILIDFSAAPDEVHRLFDERLFNLDSFFLALSAIYGSRLYPRESLIILDEIQLFPKARSAIKHLVADGRYDYLETGSLISIHDMARGNLLVPSEEETIHMYPMDLEEVLWAFGEEPLWYVIQEAFTQGRPLSEGLHRKAMDLYRCYLIVGGMPQAVATFCETRDVERVDAVKRRILRLYRNDMEKYPSGTSRHAQRIFDSLPAQLSRPYRRFKPSLVESGLRTRNLEDAIQWLEDSMIVNICWRTADPMIGMSLNRDTSAFKCFVGDTGLLVSMAFSDSGSIQSEVYARLLSGKLEVDEGPLTENMVAQMLRAAGRPLFYYSSADRSSALDRMEVDFLISKSPVTNRHNICPLEVKSAGSRATKSLDKFTTKFANQAGMAYVISRRNLHVDESRKRTWLPLYMVSLL